MGTEKNEIKKFDFKCFWPSFKGTALDKAIGRSNNMKAFIPFLYKLCAFKSFKTPNYKSQCIVVNTTVCR